MTVKNLRNTLSELIPTSPLAFKNLNKFELIGNNTLNPFLKLRKSIFTPRDKFFKYRILQGDIFCNSRMFRFKMSPSPNCGYCEDQIETVKHIIWECPRSFQAWQIFNSVTTRCCGIEYATYESVILGSPNKIRVLESLIVEILKLILTKDRTDQINEEMIKNTIKLYYKIEKIAMRERELIFKKRWHKLEQIFTP